MREARFLGMSGATVLRGIMGFGRNARIHEARFLELSSDSPVIIEIVDTDENIERLLPKLREMIREGFAIVEKVRVIDYGRGKTPIKG